jgi:hypothetical protein
VFIRWNYQKVLHMKTKIEEVKAKADWLLDGMKAHPDREGVWQVTVNFSGYAELYGVVQDLMKLCTVAMVTEEDAVSSTVDSPSINLGAVMELAIQLMPANVPEFLDGVKVILDDDKVPEEEQLEYNYSSIRVVE